MCCLCSLLIGEDLPTLSITSGFDEPESTLIENMMKEVSKLAKINILYDNLPNKRSLVNANTGVTDGEASRVWEINDYYPNLIRVPSQNHIIDLVVLSKKKILNLIMVRTNQQKNRSICLVSIKPSKQYMTNSRQ